MSNYVILAVDDQKFNYHFLKHTLKEYTLVGVTSGKEALAYLQFNLPDLILLDVVMPEMNGYELIKILKSDDRTHKIPVIFVTSMNSIKDEELGFDLGATDYIVKPFNPTIVRARVKNALRFYHQQKLLEKMAQIDGLTEIPNRRYFEQTLEKVFSSAVRNKRDFCLIMIDVDYFKHYNDFYGHYKGDEALTKIASTIQSCLKRPDDFLARYGGEEFVVILPDTDKTGGLKIAEDIRQAVYDLKIPHQKVEFDAFLTISLGGYSSIPENGQTAHYFVEKADLYLYQAKSLGRNRVVWG